MRVTSASGVIKHEFNDMVDISVFHEHVKGPHMSSV